MDRLPHEREGNERTLEELLEVGRKVLRAEAEALLESAMQLDTSMGEAARNIHCCKGRLVVSGLGKSGLIGRKIAATFASLGTPSFFLHASEGVHGDLGMVCREDVGLFLSNSGETREVLELLPYFRRLGATVIAMTGNVSSRLAREADLVLCSRVEREADPLGLAPHQQYHPAACPGGCPGGNGDGTQGAPAGGFCPLSSRGKPGKAAPSSGARRYGRGRPASSCAHGGEREGGPFFPSPAKDTGPPWW